jgi:uncharacterized protein YjgD (DUF1641 family)
MKQPLNEQFRRMQKIAGIITESQLNESRFVNQDLKDLQAQHDILKKVSIFYREKAKKLGVDINLVGDFLQAMEALEAAIFKADYNAVDENQTNEAEMGDISPEQAVDKAMDLASKLEKSPELDKLASKVASDPNLMKQLEKALAQGGVMMNEELEQLDNNDMKTLALNLAKKAEKMNEGISNNPDADDTSAGLAMAAAVGGGTLGSVFSSAIAAAIPAAISLFAGPAVVGGVAGVALFLLARKVYLLMNPDL